MSERLTYSEKLKDPRWQKRRLELLEAADWTCGLCRSKTRTLHVHHGVYRKNTEPWDYEDAVMHVLCELCHTSAEESRQALYEIIAAIPPATLGRFAFWFEQMPVQVRPQFLESVSLLFSGTPEDEWPEADKTASVLSWIQRQSCNSIIALLGDYERRPEEGQRTEEAV